MSLTHARPANLETETTYLKTSKRPAFSPGASTPVAQQGHARNKPHEPAQKMTVVNYGG